MRQLVVAAFLLLTVTCVLARPTKELKELQELLDKVRDYYCRLTL